jgi:PIN domain nuclease of toxin-antitoxin system
MGSRRLAAATRRRIEGADSVYVSAASIWEISIKARLGKIDANPQALVAAIGSSGFAELSVTSHHAAAVANLPLHHSDPFDRLLLAQAFTEPLHLITADHAFAPYGGAVTIL